jgi:hypothetical protein
MCGEISSVTLGMVGSSPAMERYEKGPSIRETSHGAGTYVFEQQLGSNGSTA